jgi:two-component system phosphate regulon sensor histidine kinase PhoR
MSLLDTKNLSPRTLSLSAAVILALVNAIVCYLVLYNFKTTISVFLVTFVVVYFVYHYTLQRFIYRKIKLIYKFIYQTKATKREEYFYQNVLPQKSIDEVSEDVEKWASQKKQEIEVLKANEKYRREFLMNLAHELRTPIFSIQGYIDTLLGGAIDDEEVNRKFLSNAGRSTDRLVRLVDDLDEISKLESGKIALIQEHFCIQELIREVYDELSLKAEERNIVLTLKKGTERPIFVVADKLKIKQVVVNLVDNAIKYGNDKGEITSGCYEVDDKHVYVEVSDNGPGISEDHLPRIFERFYRADRSRARTIGGTGLGLAIVKHIIEAHGQTVNVRSTPGVGSSFGFTLDKVAS